MAETTNDLLRVEAIFHEALAAPAEARAGVIENLCKGNRELAAEALSLLEAYEAQERQAAACRVEPGTGRETQAESRQIGPYLLDRLLGRGGMGAVYLAHRVDGQFEQQVAVKLIDLPLATEIFQKRFRQERQILAGLQHPYIARLMDGGVTAGGELYLVMEYVNGTPIHRYCEEHNLTVAQRLALFVRVCEAVQFAHQNLIVHRDLKSDNILVMEDGTPRLLDFGTAKLLSPSDAAEGSEPTREGYHAYTPQYASPEQVLGSPVTTASDTYSLGVLLYLLLTGKRPYELKELTTGEMLRVICQQAPLKPSEATGSGKRLDADLEAILEKALRKEARDRYLTAEQFAGDIRAFLAGQPVGARQGTLRYLACRFAHRHKLALASAALLLVTMLAGLVGVLWQAKVANEERRKAEARSADLRQLSNSLLSELDEAIKELPGSTGAQKLLVTRVLEHLDRMAKDAQGDRQSQLDLVDAYTRLGNIQGNLYYQNLGDRSGALVSLDKALALAAPLARAGSMDHQALRALALAQVSRSEVFFGPGSTQEAIASMQEAVQTYDRLTALPEVTPIELCEAASAYGVLGDGLVQAGASGLKDNSATLAAYRRASALSERAFILDPHLIRAQRGLSIVQWKIGKVELETDPALALKDFQAGLERIGTLPQAEQESLHVLRLRNMLLLDVANALVELGVFSEANTRYTEVLQRFQRISEADPQDMRSLGDLEIVLNRQALGFEYAADPALAAAGSDRRKNLAEAERLWIQTNAVIANTIRHHPTDEDWLETQADAEVHLGTIQSILHAAGGGGSMAKSGVAGLKDLTGKTGVSSVFLDMAAGDLLMVEPASLRDPKFAVACAERAVALSHRRIPSMLMTLTQAYRATGRTEKSRETAKEGLALLPAPQPGSVKPRIRKLLEAQTQMRN